MKHLSNLEEKEMIESPVRDIQYMKLYIRNKGNLKNLLFPLKFCRFFWARILSFLFIARCLPEKNVQNQRICALKYIKHTTSTGFWHHLQWSDRIYLPTRHYLGMFLKDSLNTSIFFFFVAFLYFFFVRPIHLRQKVEKWRERMRHKIFMRMSSNTKKS